MCHTTWQSFHSLKVYSQKYQADRFMADNLALYLKAPLVQDEEQRIVSFWTMYNELMQTDPSVLKALVEEPWVWPPQLE